MTHSKTRALIALAAAGSLLAATPADAKKSKSAKKTTITLSGSTSVTPLTVKLAKAFKQSNRHVTFRVLQGGSDVGVTDAARGRVTFGMSSRDPQKSDPGGLKFYKVARDGVCLATHPQNRLPNLSQKLVQDIFSGRIRSWSQVPGAKATGPIDLITRTASSGTADAFQSIFMGPNLRVSGNASQKASNGLVQQTVRSNRNAIAYLDFKFTGGTGVAPFEGVPCNLRNAKSGQYRGVRNFWFVSRGTATGDAAKFIKWVRSARGQKIVASEWVTYR